MTSINGNNKKQGEIMEYPYCNSDLIEGFIDSGRYSFKWHEKDMNLIERITVFGG